MQRYKLFPDLVKGFQLFYLTINSARGKTWVSAISSSKKLDERDRIGKMKAIGHLGHTEVRGVQ